MRMSSFANESTRYCNYSKDKFNNEITFVIPSWANIPEGRYDYRDGNWVNADNHEEIFVKDIDVKDKNIRANSALLCSLSAAEEAYTRITQRYSYTAQCAREVLPMSTKSELCMKANLREWRHFFSLRCSTAAHPDIRVLALDLLKQMHEKVPVIFDDLYERFIKSNES